MASRIWGALLASASVMALSAQAPAAESIETVVVTAAKRAEQIREVPIAVTALTADQLAKLHASDFADFVSRVPGMAAISAEPTHTNLVLRGITTQGVGATVGTYLDETPYGSSSALANGSVTSPNIDTFDIARVEVLRGPQGTLYGSSTLGGLLKFVTNAPDPTGFAATVEAGGVTEEDGSNGGLVRAMVNVPLSDTAALRVVGYYNDNPGFIDDPVQGKKDVNGVKVEGGRASVLWNASSKLSVRLTGLMQDISADSDFSQDMTPDATFGLTFKPLFGELEHGRVADEFSDVRYRLYNATVDYDLGWAALTSATSYGTFNDHQLTDATNIYGLFIDAGLGQKKFTEEVRLASPTDQTFEWLAGLYYTHENADLLQNLVVTPSGPVLGFVALNSRYVETAGFADFTYHFSPAFDVSLGGRFSHNSQSAIEFGLASANGDSDENVFTWSVAPRWHVDDDTMVYARVAKGYRPGGPNALPPLSNAPPTFDADSLINYELGAKTTMLDGRLSLDADAFYIDWSDVQLLTVIDNFGVNANGGTAVSEGVEWNLWWLPLDRLSFNFGGAYTDAHLTSDTDPLLVGAKSGDRLPYSPHWSTALDANYDFEAVGDFKPHVGASWLFVGERMSGFDPANGQKRLPSYSTFDLRAGVQYDRWSVDLYAKNVGNEHGITSVGNSTSAASAAAAGAPFGVTTPTVAVIRPRVLGVTLTGKF